MQGNMNEPAIECWQRNLAVCLFGAFTTVFAMTLILPFLPVYIGQLGYRATPQSCSGRVSPTPPLSSPPGW